jgi:hypothetical protein
VEHVHAFTSNQRMSDVVFFARQHADSLALGRPAAKRAAG